MHACVINKATRHLNIFAPELHLPPSCTCACFSGMSFGLVQADYQYSFPSIFPLIAVIYRSGRTHLSIRSLRWRVLLHHTLWRHGVVSSDALLLILHILLVCHLVLLFRCHSVVWRHTAASRHACLWSWDLRVVDVFRRVDGRFGVHAVLVPWSRLGRIEACLEIGVLGRVNRMVATQGSIPGWGSCPRAWWREVVIWVSWRCIPIQSQRRQGARLGCRWGPRARRPREEGRVSTESVAFSSGKRRDGCLGLPGVPSSWCRLCALRK